VREEGGGVALEGDGAKQSGGNTGKPFRCNCGAHDEVDAYNLKARRLMTELGETRKCATKQNCKR
jgi:hypothetical protein